MSEQHKILVVDDEADLREILQFNLESEGYIVDTAESAEQALRILTPEHELILLDVMMDGMSGFKMAEKLRKDLHNETPIIFLTAKDTENDMLTGFNLGGDDYISKPFGVMEFLSRVRALLRRCAPQKETQSEAISFGGVTIDYKKRVVLANNEPCTLTYKEFELLYYLLKNRGIVLSRDKIMEVVWGFDFEGESRTVDMHIKTLRQKLEEHGVKNLIQTVRSVGYKIEG